MEDKRCRICIETSSPDAMFSPCDCSGSLKYVHKECLLRWVNTCHNSDRCDVCLSQYNCHFVAKRPDVWQIIDFLKRNVSVFLLTFFVSIQFITGIVAAFCGIALQYKKGCHFWRVSAMPQMVTALVITVILTAIIVSNIFWFVVYCVLTAEVLSDSWKEIVVFVIED